MPIFTSMSLKRPAVRFLRRVGETSVGLRAVTLKKTRHSLQLEFLIKFHLRKKTKKQKVNINKHLLDASLILNVVRQGVVSSSLRHCAITNP
jgi:hypothetical protein